MKASDLGLPYAHDVVERVEAASCSMGCQLAVPVDGTGPGGACRFITSAYVDGDVPFRRKGKQIVCTARRPIPRAVLARPPKQDGLFDV